MKNFLSNYGLPIIIILFIWVFCSLMGSIVKSGSMNCDKSYPIDYVLFTSLFCEIKE